MYFCVTHECRIPLEIRSEHTVPLELEFTDVIVRCYVGDRN